MQKGYTNKTYIESDKFIKEKKHNGFNHKVNYEVVNKLNFVPKLVEQTNKKIITKFINAENTIKIEWTKDLLEQIAFKIRKVHLLDYRDFPKRNLKKRVIYYMKKAKENGYDLTLINKYWNKMSKIFTKMNTNNATHNDLAPYNILNNEGELIITDWEYSTRGDKHFDLAYFIIKSKLNPKQEKIFLNSYDSTEEYQTWFEDWLENNKKAVSYITILWAYAYNKTNFIDIKFYENILKK
ncbi:MAG: phosphotransferase [Mollicutes bacterium PWAP]|nr:phosphotransferase [Mollicutes bacterium PWAP]